MSGTRNRNLGQSLLLSGKYNCTHIQDCFYTRLIMERKCGKPQSKMYDLQNLSRQLARPYTAGAEKSLTDLGVRTQ